MKKKFWILGAGIVSMLAIYSHFTIHAQDLRLKIEKPDRPTIALPDLRGTGDAQKFMDTFNRTVWDDISSSGLFKMAPKSMYPLQVPNQPTDFRPPRMPTTQPRRGEPAPKPISQGPWLSDWSSPPVSAGYLAFGYTALQSDQLVLRGWLYNVAQQDVVNAQVFGKTYLGKPDENGARQLAHEFASDILKQFGSESLAGSKIYFVRASKSGRNYIKEIWSMDPDGANQQPVTRYNSICTTPAVSPDGKLLAFTSFATGNPAIFVHSLETNRKLRFYNQVSPMAATPEFTPDGKQILFSLSVGGWAQLHIANLDGSGLKRMSFARAVEVEPKVNPKTGAELVFVSGRGGPQQIYKMNMDGANIERLTTGEGEASNPAWSADGQHLAFAWTRGYAPGNWNIFIMDVSTRRFDQLTTGAGRNENPVWAPDGRHIVFSSNRTGSSQIWTMLADGSQVKQLTTQGQNFMPVWGR